MGIFSNLFRKAPENAEIKGYYGPEPEGVDPNEYFRAISTYLRGFELPPMDTFTREQIKRIYETSAPVMGVVNKIAGSVGELIPYLELSKDGDYIDQHWVLDLLRHPNDRFSPKKFGEAWAINKLLFGDAWVYAPKRVGAYRGQVREMYIIPSQIIEIERGGEEKPMKGLRLLGGNPKAADLNMENVFESFDFNLDPTSFFGTSKVVAAAVYLTVMERGMRRESAALNNGGVANIITPAKDNMGVLPQDADSVEEKFNKPANANKTLAFRIPIDVHQLGSAPVDLGILESHKAAIEALCFVYGLPVDLYYGQSKYENAKEAKKTVYESLAIPMANEFADDLLRYLKLDREGFRLVVNEDAIEVLKERDSDVLQTLNLMHASLNELREANGYERVEEPWADQPILPLGVMFGNEGLGEEDINEVE